SGEPHTMAPKRSGRRVSMLPTRRPPLLRPRTPRCGGDVTPPRSRASPPAVKASYAFLPVGLLPPRGPPPAAPPPPPTSLLAGAAGLFGGGGRPPPPPAGGGGGGGGGGGAWVFRPRRSRRAGSGSCHRGPGPGAQPGSRGREYRPARQPHVARRPVPPRRRMRG